MLEEALRSPHYRDYLKTTGKLALQFGYSDSGRYVGQLAASYLIERLRLKIAQTLQHHGVTGVEVILFDTHGESIGRGAHPGSLADRLKYLSPTASRQALGRAGLKVREEAAFQGGDGYLLFGTPELALATITRIAEQTYHPAAGPIEDPVYADPDFAADFFATIRSNMEGLVEDAGYAALLGAFGPSLLDKTGSRPSARQSDGMGGATRIRHPSELRAIPNNAILQQIGWCANTLQGIGAAAARHPETFTDLRQNSRRFKRAMDLASHALAHSDIEVLRAVIATLDPGTWLDRAAHTRRPGRREALGRRRQGARAAGHLGRRAVDVPPHFRRSSGAAGRLAGRAAHGEPRNPAARAALGADPPHLAAGDRDSRFLAAPRRHAAGAGGGDPAPGHRRIPEYAGGDLSLGDRPRRRLRLWRTGAEPPHRRLRAGTRGDFCPHAPPVRHGAGNRDRGDARSRGVRVVVRSRQKHSMRSGNRPTRS